MLQGLEFDGSDSPRRQELRTWKSLPDAPSARPPTQAEKFRTFIDEARSPLTFGAAGINASIMHETELGRLSSGGEARLTALYKGALIQKESSAFFGKYLFPSLLKQDPRYHPSSSQSFWGRAMYAASRTVITRNDSEKTTLNTSYFLGLPDFGRDRHCLPPILEALHFGDVQNFWLDDRHRRGHQPPARVWARHPANG